MSILTLLAALLPSATLLMSNPSTDSPDYTTVPPDPYEVEQRLSAAPINAQEAVKQAEEKSGGTVTSLATRFNGENVEYELVVVLNGVSRKVIVDGATGAVTAPMVSIPSAIRTAIESTDGLVKAVFENKKKLVITHKAFNGMKPKAMHIDVGVPYHPAALKFYKEQGM